MIISYRQFSASERLPRESISPSSTAASPLSTVPTSITSSPVASIISRKRSGDIDEFSATKRTIRSCICSKYERVCGTPRTRPFILTGWIVMVADGVINEWSADTARGTPIE